MARGKHEKRSRTGLRIALAFSMLLTLTGGGLAVAAYRYDLSTFDRILPGVTIDGVDVSDLTREEAISAVTAHAAIRLNEILEIRAVGTTWTTSPQELGVRVDVETVVDAALELNLSHSRLDRVLHRLRDEPVGVDLPLSYTSDPDAVERFVSTVVSLVDLKPRSASITSADGELVLRHSRIGRSLKVGLAQQKVLHALEAGYTTVDLPVIALEPEVTEKSIGPTIVVRRDVKELFLYEGLKVDRTYPVATAAAGYITPPGTWTIVNKAEYPTWYNPAPDTWGASLPLVIPPGPGNPLGTRALYLNAPGIRIHGTYDVDSIGTAASHGCIRMLMPDVEELYELIPIGTTVIVI